MKIFLLSGPAAGAYDWPCDPGEVIEIPLPPEPKTFFMEAPSLTDPQHRYARYRAINWLEVGPFLYQYEGDV